MTSGFSNRLSTHFPTMFQQIFASRTIPSVRALVVSAGLSLVLTAASGQATFTTLAGNAGYGAGDGTGAAAGFNGPSGVAVDGFGNVYVADFNNNTIRKITSAGVVTTLAGTAGVTGSLDGTGAAAQFNNPNGVAVDGSGNVYVADSNNYTIRKITPAGVVTTLAGTAGTGGSADGTGAAARFNSPNGVAVDGTGNVYVLDSSSNTIRKITSAGVVTTLAGSAANPPGSADGTGAAARFSDPFGIAVDGSGNVYVADNFNNTIRKITSGGVVTTLAGSATNPAGSADGTGAAARFSLPWAAAVDGSGNVYVADVGNNTIRKITSGGVVTTLAGSAANPQGSADGTGAAAQFNSPYGLAVDGSGNVYVADTFNNTIRKITSSGVVTTLAGTAGGAGSTDGTAAAARFNGPSGVAVDGSGNVYVADTYNNTIRKITSGGAVTTLAGTAGIAGSGDGTGAAARFNNPNGVAVDGFGNVYVADTNNSTIRKITPAGVVTTLAGTAGTGGSADGTGAAARFNNPNGVALDGFGNVYVADTNNSTIRKITSGGAVTTLAGTAGIAGSGDGTGAAAQFRSPYGVAVDGSGNVYVADTNNSTIRKITPAGVVTTLAGTAGTVGSADGTGAAARFYLPYGVAVDASGNVYVLDSNNNTIREITSGGAVTTLAGTAGTSGSADGTGAAARFSVAYGVAVDGSGNIYVADSNNNSSIRIGFLSTPPAVTGVSPSTGPTAGGTFVTISGHFIGATAVSFGGAAAASFTLNSPTQITATSPAGAASPVDITVTNGGVTSPASSSDLFTYVAAPSITSSLTASGTYGSAFSTYTIAASNAPTSFNATGLPPGLTVSTSSGAITGTPTDTSGSPYSVTLSATNIGGTGNATLVFAINKAGLTISGVTAGSKTYDRTTTAALNTGSATLGGAVNSDSLTLVTSGATGAFSDQHIGPGKTVTASGFSVTGTNSGNYTLTQPTTTANISALGLTVSGLSANGKTYDGTTAATLAGTASLVGVISGDTVNLSGTASGAFTSAGAGTGISVVISGLSLAGVSAGNYSLTTPTTSANIGAKALTVTGLSANSKPYDGTAAATLAGTGSLVGVVNADAVIFVGTASAAFASPGVGSGIGVTVSGLTLAGGSAGNYSLTQPAGLTGNITAKALTVSGLSASSKTYDGTATAVLTGTGSLVGVVSGDTVTLAGTAAGTFASAGAGSGINVAISGLSLSGVSAGNYSLTQPTATANITAKTIIASGYSASSKTYDGTTGATLVGTGSLNGVVSGDSVNLSGTAVGTFASPGVGSGIGVAISGLSLTGGSAGNYLLTLPASSAIIVAKGLTVAGLGASGKAYDGTTIASVTGTGSLVGVVNGDTVSLSGTPVGTFASPGVGTGIIVAISGLSLGGGSAGNYSLTATTTTANITAKALAITGLSATSKTYDGTTTAAVTGTGSLLGVVSGDTVTLSGAPVGTFAGSGVALGINVTITGLSLTGISAGNYSLTSPIATANITAKALTVTGLSVTSKAYDGTTTAALAGTGSLVGVVNADAVIFVGTASAAFASPGVGSGIGVTVSGLTLAGGSASNYSLTQPAGLTGNITAKALTVSGLSASSKTYDGTATAALTGAASLIGVVSGDTVFLNGPAAGTFATAGAGNGISVAISGLSLGGTSAGNYTLTQPTTTANITAKGLTATGFSANAKTYDGTTTATLAGTGTLVGVVSGDTVTLTGTASGTFASASVGSGIAVTVSGLPLGGASAGNYTLSQPAGLSANITAKVLTASGLSAANKTYDGTPTAALSGTAVLQAAETAGAGTTIDGKPYSGDTVLLGGTPAGAFAAASVGTNVAVTVSGLTLSGAQAGNYALTQPTGVAANITAKTIIASGYSASSKTYDGTTAATLAGTGVLAGVVSGDSVSLSGTAVGTFASPGVGSGIGVAISGLSLSGASAANYTVTVPGVIANISAKALTITGLSVGIKTYDATTAATLSGTAALLAVDAPGTGTTSDGRPYSGDSVVLGGTPNAVFASKVTGSGLTVTVSGLTLGGGQAGNYSLTQPAGVTGNIVAKGLTVSGVTANNKSYDGTTSASLNTSGAALVGVIAGDAVSLSTGAAVGTFASATAGTGTVTIAGMSLGGADAGNYALAQPSATGIISKATANVTLNGLSQTYTGSPLVVTATTTPSGLSMTITYGGTATPPTAPGTYPVAASISDPNYSGLASGSLVIAQAGQTITFAPVGAVQVGTPVTLVATASSGLPVSFSVASGNATVAGSTLTVQDSNPVTVQASQAGNVNYSAAPNVTQTISTATRRSQTITFNALPNVSASVGTVALTATASSGLPVTFALASGPANLAGSTLTLTGVSGQVIVQATQSGNAAFAAATPVTQTFTVTAAGPQVFFGNFFGTGSAASGAREPFATVSTGLAAYLNANGTGSLIGALPGGAAGFVVKFTLGNGGTFTATAPELTGSDTTGPTLTFTGSLSGSTLTGSIVELKLSFSLTVDPTAGVSSGIAGLYQSSSLKSANGATYSVVGTQNDVFVLALAPNMVAAGS
jgi:endonuclease YncB( thermonuclease family)